MKTGLCLTPQYLCYVHQHELQPSAATKQSGLALSLMPSGVSTEAKVYSFRLIHWLRSQALHARKTYRLVSDCDSTTKCGGNEGLGGRTISFSLKKRNIMLDVIMSVCCDTAVHLRLCCYASRIRSVSTIRSYCIVVSVCVKIPFYLRETNNN